MDIVGNKFPPLDGEIVYNRLGQSESDEEVDVPAPPAQRGQRFPPLPGEGKPAKWMFGPCMKPYEVIAKPVDKMDFLLCRQKNLNATCQANYDLKHQMLMLAEEDFSLRAPFGYQGNTFRWMPDLIMQVFWLLIVLHFTIYLYRSCTFTA